MVAKAVRAAVTPEPVAVAVDRQSLEVTLPPAAVAVAGAVARAARAVAVVAAAACSLFTNICQPILRCPSLLVQVVQGQMQLLAPLAREEMALLEREQQQITA